MTRWPRNPAKVGLETLQDVLFHLPLRYQDRTRITSIGALRPGRTRGGRGRGVAGADVAMGRRRSLLVRLQDGTGTLSLRFFHFSQAQKDGSRGTALRCYGEIRPGATGPRSTTRNKVRRGGDERRRWNRP